MCKFGKSSYKFYKNVYNKCVYINSDYKLFNNTDYFTIKNPP